MYAPSRPNTCPHSHLARGKYSVISGGGGYHPADSNSALGDHSFIGGGKQNRANGPWSAVVGGAINSTANQYDFIGGGTRNVASGGITSILGGKYNSATGWCAVAGGTAAKSNHAGSIVLAANWIPSGGADSVRSGGNEQMVLRADGGMYITNSGGVATYNTSRLINTSTGGYLSASGNWVDFSDRDGKENFTEIDNQEVLEKIVELDVTRWNYKTEGSDVQHIGPVAQDFHEAFGLGQDDKSISGLDRSGVALAAIKALNDQNKELKSEIEDLRQLVQQLVEQSR